jgi:2-polyprenyl-3-methyl-5-hydroxy-6-metoxy-1,4-benzoquinol methylase
MMQTHTQAAALAIADQAIDWARRQRDLREKELEVATKALLVVERWVDSILRSNKAPRMRAAEAAKMLDIASRVARLATGLHTQREEVSGVDGDPIRIQVAAAIAKVYGPKFSAKRKWLRCPTPRFLTLCRRPTILRCRGRWRQRTRG